MEYFLRPENAAIWAEVQVLAKNGAHDLLHEYVKEAQRLTSTQRNLRVATQPAELEGKSVEPGNIVIMLLVSSPQLICLEVPCQLIVA